MGRGQERRAGAARPFRLVERRPRVDGVATLSLAPLAGGAAPAYTPGQYVVLELTPPGATRPLRRCYSLSAAPGGRTWQITVKAIEGGAASRWLVEEAPLGLVLSVVGPLGRFVFDPRDPDPAVLLGAGIGVTPLVAMVEAAARHPNGAPVHLLLGMRRKAEHPFADELQALVAATPRLRSRVRYSQPDPGDELGRDYDEVGHLDLALLEQAVPPHDRPYRFYLCGPSGLLASLEAGLLGLGVPASRVLRESFGPQTARLALGLPTGAARPKGPALTVRFARSGRRGAWTAETGSLLDLSREVGAPIPWACGTGRCGTCLTRVLDGEVRYALAPEFPLRPGSCLPCVAQPAGPLTLDA